MLNILGNVEPADILTYARSIPAPEEFLLTREIVPNRTIDGVKYKIKSSERRVNAATFRAYDTETPLGRREVEHQTLEGMLPPVGVKFFVGELEQILLDMERGTDDEVLIDELYNDTGRGVLGIRARMELAAGDLLVDRKFSLVDENRLTLEADFGVGIDGAFTPTAAVYWGGALATPLSDELGWIQYLVDNGDGAPGRALTSRQVVGLLGRNHEYQEAYFGRGQDTYPSLNPGQVQSVRDTAGLPPITTYDVTVRVDGTNVRVLPANRFFLLPGTSEEFAQTQYGITAEALSLSRTGNPRLVREDLPGIVVTANEDDDPPKVWTRANAVAMPVMYAPKAYITAKVLA